MQVQRCLEFFNFIYDRQLIWYKKEVFKQPAPWTDDPILNKYKFCNVYRENDRCTIHLIENVIDVDIPLEDKIFNIILYRRFNIDKFFGGVLRHPIKSDGYNWKMLEYYLDDWIGSGKKVFNDAYLLCQRTFSSDYRKGDKHIQIALAMERIAMEAKVLAEAFRILPPIKIHERIKQYPLIGDFLAYQILVDASYIEGLDIDLSGFVSVGPGAKWTIEYIFGSKDYEANCKVLFSNQSYMFSQLRLKKGKDWHKINCEDRVYGGLCLPLPDVQNCCCEFRKYSKLQTNPKARKRHYKGGEHGLSRAKS